MGRHLRVLSLLSLLALSGCQAYSDATRALARAAYPDLMRNAEESTAQYRAQHPSPGKECPCEKSEPSR